MGGGGGSSSDKIAAQQAQEEARKAQARQAIDKLYGIAPGMTTTRQAQEVPVPGGGYWTGVSGAGRSSGDTREWVPQATRTVYSDVTAPVYDPAEAEANLASREAGYTDLSKRVKESYMPGLTDDRDVAERQLRFALARTGHARGSEELNQGNQISRNWDEALRNVESTGLEAANRSRGSDESTRLNLMNSINAGLDQGSALSAAANAMKIDSQNAADYVKGRTLGDLTQNVAFLSNAQSIGNGRRDARQIYDRLFAPTAGVATGGNSGVVVR